MTLDPKYERAIEVKLADPEATWLSIAEQIGVTDRQLRRVRESPEWKDYWASADKQDMLEILRKKAVANDNAAMYRLYFELTGQIDELAQEALLHMSDADCLEQAGEVAKWYQHQVSKSSK